MNRRGELAESEYNRLVRMNEERSLKKREAQLQNFIVDSKTGCWIWQGARNKAGYGRVKRYGRMTWAHRLFYEVHVGPIPSGMLVCHHCDNPPCVNPEHLFLGTYKDNEADKKMKGRKPMSPFTLHPELRPRGEKHHRAKFTNLDIIDIRSSSLPARELASRYNVAESTIHRIKSRKFWKHV